MMIDGRDTCALPTLRKEAWTHKGKKPNPISISEAREMLAVACATIPCELPGTDIHSCAWMVQTEAEWKAREGITDFISPRQNKSRTMMGTSQRCIVTRPR